MARYPYSLSYGQKNILLRIVFEQSAVDEMRFPSHMEAYAWVGAQINSQRGGPVSTRGTESGRMMSSPPKRIRLTVLQKNALLGEGYSASELDSMRFGMPQEGYEWLGSRMGVASGQFSHKFHPWTLINDFV